MDDLKQRAVRGALAQLVGQMVCFILRLLFIAIMARLLDPADFGLVAMVTVVTGFFELLGSAGLSTATIQKITITHEQISTLFWANLLVGVLLATLCVLIAPLVAYFYGEPRLFLIMVIMGMSFIITGGMVQHRALLDRNLRFVAMSVIVVLCQTVSLAVGIGMAIAGFHYWALVATSIIFQAMFAICVWTITAWIPGLPRRKAGTRAMLRLGGTMTLNSLVLYVAYNFDKLLVGRFWGVDALGFYGRAYQLINIPTQQLNSTIGGVTFAALSRLQDDPVRLRRYFLKGYGLANSITLPTTIFCALFADDIVLVALGPKWTSVTTIFRLLTPTILAFGIINPLTWLLNSTGLAERNLRISLVIAALTIVSCVIALPFGPNGVAFGVSTVMTCWLIPHILWSLQDAAVSPKDILLATGKPLFSAVLAAAILFVGRFYFAQIQSSFFRLGLEVGVMFFFYFGTLLFVMGNKTLYADLFRGLKNRS